MKILMIVTVIFDKKYCNNNSNNRCTFFIELPVSVHDFTNHIYDHNIDNDITEYVNEEAQIDETVIINTEHEKQLYLSTSPDILEEEGETSAEAVVVPENTRIKTFLKNIRSNKNSKRNTSIDSIQRELWALKKEKYQKQIEVLEIIRKKELEGLKGKELDNLLKTKQLNSL
jgi:hypothetical protein